MRKIVWIIGILFLCAGCTTQPLRFTQFNSPSRIPANEKKPTLSVLFVSDIHFNSLADPTLVPTLISSPVSKWTTVFATAKNQNVNSYGADTDYSLLMSAMSAMKAALPHPDLIVLGGDFIAHKFHQKFRRVVPHASRKEYADFFNKTEQFLARLFIKNFPQTQILPVLGNNDAPCGDYKSQPQGSYLRAFARAWQPAVNRFGGAPDFVAQFSKDGFYSATVRKDKTALRVLALNDDFWMSHYKNKCGIPSYNAGPTELHWLNQKLQMSSNVHEPVWLMTHGPAGLNLYSTFHFHPTFCHTHLFSMIYKEPYNSQFISLVNKYANTIRVMLAGHTHMNEFRVYGANAKTPVVQFIDPAVSPIYKNNPAFDVLSVEPKTFAVLDVKTYSLNLAAVLAGSLNSKRPWVPISDLDREFDLKSASGRSLEILDKELTNNNNLFNLYAFRFMSESPFHGFATKNRTAYACGLLHFTAEGFSHCSCK